LEDLGPEALVLPPAQDPKAQDLLVPIEVDPHSDEQEDLLELAFLVAQLGSVGVDEDGEPVRDERLRLVEVQPLPDEFLGLLQGLRGEGEP